jgi:hypothetical protein
MRPTKVDSSYIQSLRYDQAAKILRVRFADATLVDYFDVSPRTYRAIMSADSHGEKFIELVRDSHKFKIVKAA